MFSIDQEVKKKSLPSCLFENIIFKSKELKWHIQCLSMFIPHRDTLNWKNIDVKSYITHNAFALLNQVKDYPLTSLAISVNEIDEKSMESLCSMGSTIECLDLRYQDRYLYFFTLRCF